MLSLSTSHLELSVRVALWLNLDNVTKETLIKTQVWPHIKCMLFLIGRNAEM